jgi:hypothetical protein
MGRITEHMIRRVRGVGRWKHLPGARSRKRQASPSAARAQRRPRLSLPCQRLARRRPCRALVNSPYGCTRAPHAIATLQRAEHNEGMLATLEEVALHQQSIERIELLGHLCPK